MRAVVQRVTWARVCVDGKTVGEIGPGLTVLLGVGKGDTERRADQLAKKLVDMRIFADDEDRMNRSLVDIGGGMLVISQFTLFADLRKGRRPFFGGAESPDRARELCDVFAAAVRGRGVEVATGSFGAMMQVELCNDGPVTIIIDSSDLEGPRRG